MQRLKKMEARLATLPLSQGSLLLQENNRSVHLLEWANGSLACRSSSSFSQDCGSGNLNFILIRIIFAGVNAANNSVC